MTTHITSRYATTLGPFLTLLVLTASRGTNTAPDRLATVETAPVEVAGERARGGPEDARRRNRAGSISYSDCDPAPPKRKWKRCLAAGLRRLGSRGLHKDSRF